MQLLRTLSTLALAASLMALAPAVSRAAAEGSVSGPTLGYFFDQQQRSLRPILGVPGASQIGAGLGLNVELRDAEVAPGQQYALGVTAEGGVAFVDLRGEVPQTRTLAVGVGASRVLISPTGEAAAVYDRQGRQVQFLTGMLDAPAAGSTVSLSGVQGLLTAMAVSDDGRTLLAATSSANADGGLYVVEAGGEVRRVSTVGRVLSMSFLPGQDNALVGDYGRSEVLRIDGVTSVAVAAVIAAGRDGVSRPVAVGAGGDLTHAVAALDGSSQVALIPLAGGPPSFVDCNCRPRELSRMRGASVFRLTSDATQPLYVLEARRLGPDGSALEPRVSFVPAGSPAAAPAPGATPIRPRSAR